MSSAYQSIKLSGSLVDQARQEAPVFSRSIAGQVEHWARLGRALESSPGFTLDRVRSALAGELDPGSLSDDEWSLFDDLRFEGLGEGDNPAADAFAAKVAQTPGAVGYDEQGRLVRVRADGTTEIIG